LFKVGLPPSLLALLIACEAPPAAASGDAAAGAGIFFGKGRCSDCHRVGERGGRLGPELSRIGAMRSPQEIAQAIRNPNQEIPQGFRAVVLATHDGDRITGVVKNEDTFSIQLMGLDERIYLFLKEDLRSMTHGEESLMPAYDERELRDEELRDLQAYLGERQ
jgi:cytochrome c oxidase cbb3-type subunit 3